MLQVNLQTFSLFPYIIKSVFRQQVGLGMSWNFSHYFDCFRVLLVSGILSIACICHCYSGGFFKREGRAKDHEVLVQFFGIKSPSLGILVLDEAVMINNRHSFKIFISCDIYCIFFSFLLSFLTLVRLSNFFLFCLGK